MFPSTRSAGRYLNQFVFVVKKEEEEEEEVVVLITVSRM
jgi:hypothetical protein